MSQRVKKPGRTDESQVAKRRRRRPTGSDADEDGTRSGSNSGGNGSLSGMWTPRHLSDLKVSSIYNRNSAEAPAEVTSLYRKDLISAMKLPDSEPLTPEEYWLITDTWKQEWEKGVQVPVNPESLPESQVVVISPVADRSHDFRMPKKKYVRVTHDDFFNPDYHQLVSTAARAEKVCSYDLDDVDAAWLGCANADRVMQILPVISEFLMEQVIEELELQCWEQVQTILKSQEGLGIEYDENVICDVCRSPESEEGNEMVFCDSCNICVHQACYGITSIPSGSFLCRTCTLGIRPSCILCPNMGGAMKATRSGHKWAHVACAIWIPEVSIGSVEKMEPITKISAIPQSRWSLVCVICKDKSGACIQCSVKTCKTAYHVTCAFKNGLEMKPIIVDENAEDGIKLRSYCQKHSVNTKKDKTPHSGSEEDGEKKKSRAMTAEERNLARAEKLQQIEAEFFKYVRLKDVSQNLAVDMDIVNLVYNYWKLKRKSLNNRPLVPPRPETTQLLTQQQEQDLEQMKMFVQLRQDLERVRNLCYMVSRREKLSRSYFRLREQTFQKQVTLLSEKSFDLSGISGAERSAILDANHGPSVYDQFFSQSGDKSSFKDFESLVTLIAGDGRPEVVNGLVKTKTAKGKSLENPYKKTFLNGARRRSESLSSLSETEPSGVKEKDPPRPGVNKTLRKPLAYLFDTDSSMDAIIMSNSGRKTIPKKMGKGRGLKAIGKGLLMSSTSESELDLPTPVPKGRGKGVPARRQPIYSDTESDTAPPKKALGSVATKGALKEFSAKKVKPQVAVTKSTIRVSPLLQTVGDPPKKRGRVPGKKKKADTFEPTELIVPQREAAKKASESIRSVKNPKGKEHGAGAEDGESPLLITSKDPTLKETPKAKEQETLSGDEKPPVAPSRKLSVPKVQKLNRKGKGKAKEEVPCPKAETKSDYDLDEDGAGAVSIVPQRQAAKKAAEHIRSCQSNVVAARLIIEDEMEASRKKSKSERTPKGAKRPEKSPTRGRPPSTLPYRDLAFTDKQLSLTKNSKIKEKLPFKGGETPRGGRLGRRESEKSPGKEERKGVDSDWPFLDKGSQSACRRSRERSSSSSSSTSGSSTSSDSSSSSHSSSSSRSSSPGSASPVREPRRLLSSTPLPTPVSPISPAGPGRKLKTSERSPRSGNRTETSPRAKPLAKDCGPPKAGPRRTPAPLSHSSSPEQSTRGRGSLSPEKRKQKAGTSQSPHRRPLSSPYATHHTQTQLEEKTEGESPALVKTEKSSIFDERREETKTPPKTLIRDELALSSDSEEEPPKTKEIPAKVRPRTQSRPSLSTISSEMKNRPMPKTKKKELGLLSEESESADEKENCLSPSPAESPRKAQKAPVPAPNSLLSPLAPSGENKDLKLSDTEPDSKRARHDSPRREPSASTTSSQVQSFLPATTLSMPKSIFSPVGHGKESDFMDFDSDLYDLARSVTGDYAHEAEEGAGSGTLAFSFSQDLLSREDNKEDSARATMNLVEKLRLQHLRKSSITQRSSVEGNPDYEDLTSEEPQKSPVQIGPGSPVKFEQTFSRVEIIEECEEKKVNELANNSPRRLSRCSPDRRASIPGDERWVPPSFISHQHPTNLHTVFGQGQDFLSNGDMVPDMGLIHNPSKTLPEKMHQIFHPPEILKAEIPEPSEVCEVFGMGERLLQSVHGHLLLESDQSHENHILPSRNLSPSLPPGISLPPGLTATYAGTPPLHAPFHSTHSPFIYPLNSTLASVVTSLASGGLPFFHTQAQMPKLSPQLSVKSSLTSPPTSYPLTFPHHFGNLPQQSSLPCGQGLDKGIHSSDPIRRRPSDSTLTSGMPPLSKPPLTSPSLLLASNNSLSAPAPPPQSTVAQIIESVIQASNNHSVNQSTQNKNNGNQCKSGILNSNTSVGMNFQLGMNQLQKLMSNNNNTSPSLLSSENLSNLRSNSKSPLMSPSRQPKPVTPTHSTVSDFSAVLSNKTNENILPQKITPTRDYTPVILTPNNSSVSPKGAGGAGRGRRPTTPKVKAEKTVVVEETSPKVRGKSERKVSGSSPGRVAKGSTTPRKGTGRGKNKGKNVLVRKDLAGTVYDIDFDEFEENTEEKFDLRMLRDRRKSSDVHSGDYNRKSESSEDSPIRIEKQSPCQKMNFDNEMGQNRQRSGSGMQPSSLSGPVDMRTYNASESTIDDGLLGKVGFTNVKEPSSAAELASLLMGSITSSATVKDLEELDLTLEALTSPTKVIPKDSGMLEVSVNNSGLIPKGNQVVTNVVVLGPGGDSSLSSSKDSFTTTISEDNHSRNQLKVKIKGPFLDANYSSHSISQPAFQQATHSHHNEPSSIFSNPMMMSNPSNLRRMRKKELLRQYCYQDMNMDGKYTNPPGLGPEFSMGGPQFHPHPYGRAVITIPKAVASMAIIPSSKDDYGLDPSDLTPLPTPPPLPLQEKKKRSRGVNREMAALGLLEKGERWRDTFSILPSVPVTSEANSRKRVRTTTKPNRNTFIPPTLAESTDSAHTPSTLGAGSKPGSGSSTPSIVTAVSHPTPKLKIKFGDLTSSTLSSVTTGSGYNLPVETNHVDYSDKETPSKKVTKGRPPKKRGVSEISTPPPPSMEELKRQSLMYREMIMKDFENADDTKGGKKKKKSKKSKRGLEGETDDSNRSRSPEIKIITENTSGVGPKLILRFGKMRTASTASNDSGHPMTNNSNDSRVGGARSNDYWRKENGPLVKDGSSEKGHLEDSGFTGSSEGSVGSWAPSVPHKSKPTITGLLSLNATGKPNHKKFGSGGNGKSMGEMKEDKGESSPFEPMGEPGILKFKPTTLVPSTSTSTPSTATSPTLTKSTGDKLMPIRLKLHRCYEGYATKKEVDRENTNPKQSDSCEVR